MGNVKVKEVKDIVAVDSTGSSGTFQLDLELFTVPAHSKCSGAQAVTFTSGTASISDDTTNAPNQFGKTIDCGGSGRCEPALLADGTIEGVCGVAHDWYEVAGSASGGGISAGMGPANQPSIAFDQAGNLIVAWATNGAGNGA